VNKVIEIKDVAVAIRIVRLLLQAYVNEEAKQPRSKTMPTEVITLPAECDEFLAKAYQSAIVLEHKLQEAHDQPS